MPAPTDVYADPILTNVSLKYSNDQLIADKVFPILPVDKLSGFYFKYDKSNLRVPSDLRSGVSRANRTDYNVTKTAYGPLTEHSLEEAIPDIVMNQYQSPLEPKIDATNHVTEQVLINKEVGLATDLADTAIVTQYVTKSGTGQWSDYANSDPFSDIATGVNTLKQNGLKAPNTVVMSQAVWVQLQNHPDLIDRIKYNQLGVLTESNLGQLFPGIDNIYVGDAVQNTAVEGQTDSLSYVWGKHFWLMYVAPQPALRTVTAGYHLTLNLGRGIDTWDDRSVKAQFVRFTDYYQRKLIAAEAIYAIRNAVA